MGSLFILNIMLDEIRFVKGNVQRLQKTLQRLHTYCMMMASYYMMEEASEQRTQIPTYCKNQSGFYTWVSD